jgi:replicative DNA helicase
MSSFVAEKGMIGCLLIEPVVCYQQAMKAGVKEDWFADPHSRKTWNLIQKMKREMVTTMTVNEESVKRNDEIPMAFLNECLESAPIATYMPIWIIDVRGTYLRRMIKQTAVMLGVDADDPEKDPNALLAETQTLLHNASAAVEENKSTAEVYGEIIDNWHAAQDKKGVGLPTGWNELTKVIGGYRPGKVYILASRPGGGKSTFMANEAFNLAYNSKKVSIASIEMEEHELRGRMLATSADKSSFCLDTGAYDRVEIENIRPTAGAHAEMPIRINDKYMTIDQLCAWAQFEVIKHKAEFIAVDYLQLIPGGGKRFESRNVEVTNNMNKLCELAKTLNVPMLVLSQLSRNSAHEDRKPDLHDLRDSGAIEQGAHCVIFINHNKEMIGEIENENSLFIVAKNRGGPVGQIKIRFERNRQRFTEI